MNVHYDAAREVRAKGGAFYRFSGDEETRQQQMDELKRARDETEKTREEMGAVDVAPGEVEGMVAPDEAEGMGPAQKRSRALEKRKREIEERRKLLDAKRRKKDSGASGASGASSSVATPQEVTPRAASSPSPGPPPPPAPTTSDAKPRDRSPTPEYTVACMPPLEGVVDPFAALEAQTASQKSKGKRKASAAPMSADAFLASLEADIMKVRLEYGFRVDPKVQALIV